MENSSAQILPPKPACPPLKRGPPNSARRILLSHPCHHLGSHDPSPAERKFLSTLTPASPRNEHACECKGRYARARAAKVTREKWRIRSISIPRSCLSPLIARRSIENFSRAFGEDFSVALSRASAPFHKGNAFIFARLRNFARLSVARPVTPSARKSRDYVSSSAASRRPEKFHSRGCAHRNSLNACSDFCRIPNLGIETKNGCSTGTVGMSRDFP